MIGIQVGVKVDLSGLKEFQQVIDKDLKGTGQGVVRKALKQWAFIYRSEMQQRFVRNSRGGGDWPPLALSTIFGRRTNRSIGRKPKPDEKKTWGKRHTYLNQQIKKAHKQIDKGGEKAKEAKDRLADLIAKKKTLNKEMAEQAKHYASGPNINAKKLIAAGKRVDRVKAQVRKAKKAKTAKGKAFRITKKKAYEKIQKADKERKDIVTGKTVSILRDTGTLFNSIAPTLSGKPGQIQLDIPFGVRVGIGGPAQHPEGEGKTIAEIAEMHQTGGAHLPKRTIFVAPSKQALDQMSQGMERAIAKMIRDEIKKLKNPPNPPPVPPTP